MKPILVTGGEGFLGIWTRKCAHKKDINCISLDVNGEPEINSSVCQSIPECDVSAVIHLAGLLGTHELFDNCQQAIDVNIQGTLNVLQFCRRKSIPFIGVTMDHVWVNPYETTKLAAERLSQAWSREYGIPVGWVRAYNVYGPFQAVGVGHPQKIIPTFARRAWMGEHIPIWGDGEQLVDLVYVEDVGKVIIDLLLHVLDNQKNDPVYVDAGTSTPVSVKRVACHVSSYVAGRLRRPPVRLTHIGDRLGEHVPLRSPFAIGEGWDIIGWKPTHDVSKLEKTIDWYRTIKQYP